MTIPDSVTSIEGSSFFDCPSLTMIDVGKGNLNYASIDGVLYSKNINTLIEYPMGREGAFTIPSGVTFIGCNAFYCCYNLTSLIIPDSVTSIGDSAFSFTNLTVLTIPSNVTSVGEYLFVGCTSLNWIEVDGENSHYWTLMVYFIIRIKQI